MESFHICTSLAQRHFRRSVEASSESFEDQAKDKGAQDLPNYMTIVILVAGVILGLLVVIFVILLCKHCSGAKKKEQQVERGLRSTDSDDQRRTLTNGSDRVKKTEDDSAPRACSADFQERSKVHKAELHPNNSSTDPSRSRRPLPSRGSVTAEAPHDNEHGQVVVHSCVSQTGISQGEPQLSQPRFIQCPRPVDENYSPATVSSKGPPCSRCGEAAALDGDEGHECGEAVGPATSSARRRSSAEQYTDRPRSRNPSTVKQQSSHSTGQGSLDSADNRSEITVIEVSLDSARGRNRPEVFGRSDTISEAARVAPSRLGGSPRSFSLIEETRNLFKSKSNRKAASQDESSQHGSCACTLPSGGSRSGMVGEAPLSLRSFPSARDATVWASLGGEREVAATSVAGCRNYSRAKFFADLPSNYRDTAYRIGTPSEATLSVSEISLGTREVVRPDRVVPATDRNVSEQLARIPADDLESASRERAYPASERDLPVAAPGGPECTSSALKQEVENSYFNLWHLRAKLEQEDNGECTEADEGGSFSPDSERACGGTTSEGAAALRDSSAAERADDRSSSAAEVASDRRAGLAGGSSPAIDSRPCPTETDGYSDTRRANFRSYLTASARSRLLEPHSSTDRSGDGSVDTSTTEGCTTSESSRRNTTSFESNATADNPECGAADALPRPAGPRDLTAERQNSIPGSLAEGEVNRSSDSGRADHVAESQTSEAEAGRQPKAAPPRMCSEEKAAVASGRFSSAWRRRREYRRQKQIQCVSDEVQCVPERSTEDSDELSHMTSNHSDSISHLFPPRNVVTSYKRQLLARDYCIDEKTDLIFKKFISYDPSYDSKSSTARARRCHFSQRQYTDPGVYSDRGLDEECDRKADIKSSSPLLRLAEEDFGET